MKNRNKAKQKWHKIVEMFHLFPEAISKPKFSPSNSMTASPMMQSTKSLAKTMTP